MVIIGIIDDSCIFQMIVISRCGVGAVAAMIAAQISNRIFAGATKVVVVEMLQLIISAAIVVVH